MSFRLSLLYVTDLTYHANGRPYGDEDTHLSHQLRTDFDIALVHPSAATALMHRFDAVVVRNSGPTVYYQEAYDEFRREAIARGVRVFNPLTGRADMLGKKYLLDLTTASYPVIPTISHYQDLQQLPPTKRYVVKPVAGADSIGLRFLTFDELGALDWRGLVVQPEIEFLYEVSFYYIGRDFQYALYAPDPSNRWALEHYEATETDLAFARCFIEWNTLEHGIQRVDACRTSEGDLLLVELEDLNPYLSLSAVADVDREAFITNMKAALHRFLDV